MKNKYDIFFCLLFFINTQGYEPMEVGLPQKLYSTDQLPIDPICSKTPTPAYCNSAPINSSGQDLLAIDASLSTLRVNKTSSKISFIYSFANGLASYSGSKSNPFENLQWSETINSAFPYSSPVNLSGRIPVDHVYISNVYQSSSTSPVIGFVHYEDLANCSVGACDSQGNCPASCSSYHIGVASSLDSGKTWRYLGHAINTYRNGGYGVASDKTNIGGVPYIVINGWFYVYFMEYPSTGPGYISVARTSINSVLNAAVSGLVGPTWYKYNNGSWTGSALSSLGSSIFPSVYSSSINPHTDATYSLLTKKYYFIGYGGNTMKLFSSTDGITWNRPNDIALGNNIYPTIVGDSWYDLDFHTVNRFLYLIYPKVSPRENDKNYLKCSTDLSHYACQDIYQTQIDLKGGNIQPIIEAGHQ